MDFDYSPKVQDLRKRVAAFMDEHVYAADHLWHEHVASAKRWEPVPVIEELKPKARAAGLWNLWRPKTHGGTLTNLETSIGSQVLLMPNRVCTRATSPRVA